ncbi:MAG: hypothetical protein AABX78_01570, partial [Nanoarchaeota archaeon]
KNLKFIANVNYEQQGQTFLVDLSSTDPEQGNVYLFVIVASDLLNNPKEEQFKVKELGTAETTILQLTI